MSKPATMKISETQLAMLMYITIMSTVTLFVPAVTAKEAHQDAWLTGAVPMVMGILSLFLVTRLAQLYPGQTIIQYCEGIFGKIIGKLLAFLYVAFFLVTNIIIIRELAELLAIMFLPGTPIIVLCSVFILSSVYVVIKGPEVMCRMAQFLLPLFVGIHLILIPMTMPDWKIERVLPILEGGFRPILRGSIIPSAWFGEFLLVAMFMPNVNKPQQMFRKGIFAILLIGASLSMAIFTSLVVFGPELSTILTFPSMSLIKYIKIGTIFQRLETYTLVFWIGIMFMKINVFYYVTNEGLAQSLNKNNSKWILWALAVVQILGATYLFRNTLDLSRFLTDVWIKLAFIFEFALLLILWFTALVRNKLTRKP
ncbi:MAG: endospore germination permease [Bacillota bacterium]|nr:endospore germination permease [Bacillota bacterium]